MDVENELGGCWEAFTALPERNYGGENKQKQCWSHGDQRLGEKGFQDASRESLGYFGQT